MQRARRLIRTPRNRHKVCIILIGSVLILPYGLSKVVRYEVDIWTEDDQIQNI